jgi:hypothetical protein
MDGSRTCLSAALSTNSRLTPFARSIRLPRSPSEMQSEKARNHSDHNDYAYDVKDIHCFAPIDHACAQRRFAQ